MSLRNRCLVGPIYLSDENEPFRWSDPDRVPLVLNVGDRVVVLTDEGALRRGRRRWHPGVIGTVLSISKKHDRGYMVRVNEYEVLLFDDELDYPPAAAEEKAA